MYLITCCYLPSILHIPNFRSNRKYFTLLSVSICVWMYVRIDSHQSCKAVLFLNVFFSLAREEGGA